jgi:hypothetical protein
MSICSLAARASLVCLVVLCAAGCNKQDVAAKNSVQHGSAWQRQAGESPLAAANIMKQSEKNTKELNEAIASNKTDSLASMQGKLVRMDGEVADQNSSSWTMKKDGWTIVAHVSDLTPNSDKSMNQISSCCAQGIIEKVDADKKQIVLADVELAPEMKSPMASNVAAK